MKREEKFEKMEQIKDTFENVAEDFDEIIVKLVPLGIPFKKKIRKFFKGRRLFLQFRYPYWS